MSRQLKTWEPRRCRVGGTPSPKLQKGRVLPPSRLPETSSWKVLLTGTYWVQDTHEGIAETFLELPSRGSCYSQRGLLHPPGKGTEQGLLWHLGSGEAASLGVIFVPFLTHPYAHLSISLTLFFLSVSLSAPLILPGNQNGLKMCASSR